MSSGRFCILCQRNELLNYETEKYPTRYEAGLWQGARREGRNQFGAFTRWRRTRVVLGIRFDCISEITIFPFLTLATMQKLTATPWSRKLRLSVSLTKNPFSYLQSEYVSNFLRPPYHIHSCTHSSNLNPNTQSNPSHISENYNIFFISLTQNAACKLDINSYKAADDISYIYFKLYSVHRRVEYGTVYSTHLFSCRSWTNWLSSRLTPLLPTPSSSNPCSIIPLLTLHVMKFRRF